MIQLSRSINSDPTFADICDLDRYVSVRLLPILSTCWSKQGPAMKYTLSKCANWKHAVRLGHYLAPMGILHEKFYPAAISNESFNETGSRPWQAMKGLARKATAEQKALAA